MEEFPHRVDAAVRLLVTGQPTPGVVNVLGVHKDVGSRPTKGLHHEGSQPARTRTHTHTHTTVLLENKLCWFPQSEPQLEDNYITASFHNKLAEPKTSPAE